MRKRLNLTMLQWFVNSHCNFACDYCFTHQKINNMTDSMAVDTVKWFIENYDLDAKELHYNFFGTEPLMKLELIRSIHVLTRILLNAVGEDIPFTTGIVTNGSLINDRFIKFVKKYDWRVAVSYDGIQGQEYRPFNDGSSSERVVASNIRKLVDNGIKPLVLMTVTSKNIPYLDINVKSVWELGIDKLVLNNCTYGCDPYTDWSLENFTLNLKEVCHMITKEAEKGRYRDVAFLTNFLKKWCLGTLRKNTRGTCGAGQKGFAVDVEGNIFICQQAVWDDYYKVGNVREGLNWKQVDFWRNLTNPICQDCDQKECSGCYVSNKIRTGNPLHPPSDYCNYIILTDCVSMYLERLLSERNLLNDYIRGVN